MILVRPPRVVLTSTLQAKKEKSVFFTIVNEASVTLVSGGVYRLKSPAAIWPSAWIDGLAVRPMKARRLTRI